jgi:ribosomal protein S18 acetylase RimI-like enzyme
MVQLKIYKKWQHQPKHLITKLAKLLHTSFGSEQDYNDFKVDASSHHDTNDFCFYLVLKSTIISYLTIRVCGQKAELWNFCTNPKFRSQGYGTLLFELCRLTIKTAIPHLKTIQLMVLNDNVLAQKFYQRLGFEKTGKSKPLEAVIMNLEI